MAALGFVVNINSLLLLGSEILLAADSPFRQKYLLTYKLSQDHLELYFSGIRRMGGWNNNPSTQQFSHAYRALLSRASVTGSQCANIVQQDETDLLHLSPDASKVDQFEPQPFEADHDYCQIGCLSLFVTNVVEYIAGWVVRKLSPQIACGECLGALVVAANDSNHTDSLLVIKNNGGLVRPSAGVIAVVTHVEKVLRESVNIRKVTKDDLWGRRLEMQVLQRLPKDVFHELRNHFTNTQYGIDNHYTDSVRNICRVFLKLRRFHVINITNQKLKGRCVR